MATSKLPPSVDTALSLTNTLCMSLSAILCFPLHISFHVSLIRVPIPVCVPLLCVGSSACQRECTIAWYPPVWAVSSLGAGTVRLTSVSAIRGTGPQYRHDARTHTHTRARAPSPLPSSLTNGNYSGRLSGPACRSLHLRATRSSLPFRAGSDVALPLHPLRKPRLYVLLLLPPVP